MKLTLLDQESKLLILALGIFVWAVVALIYPASMPKPLNAVAVVVVGELLALKCSTKGPHSVARLGVLSVGFGIQCAAYFMRGGNNVLTIGCAVLFIYCALAAFVKFSNGGVWPRSEH